MGGFVYVIGGEGTHSTKLRTVTAERSFGRSGGSSSDAESKLLRFVSTAKRKAAGQLAQAQSARRPELLKLSAQTLQAAK